MKKRWNTMGKMTVCTLAAAMMVMVGTEFGITASAEMVIDSEEGIQEVQEMVSESGFQGVSEEDAAEAEEQKIDVTDIVVIEEDMVPGAAQPDFDPEPSEEEIQAEEPADEEVQAEVSREPEEEVQAEEPAETVPASETGVSGTLTYEDSEVVVTVIASEAAQLPADTEVKVSRLAEGSEKYEAAKEAARQSLAAGENASYTFYDVTLESEGQILDVAEGTVSVKMEFKTSGDAKKDVVKIEETESGKVARNVTDTAAADKRTGSVALDY